jgi:hypothetical protein
VDTAHVWRPPAEIDVKVPAGGLDCPAASLPQHATVPPVAMAQVL